MQRLWRRMISLLVAVVLLAACGTPVTIHLVEPEGGRMVLDGDEYSFGLESRACVVTIKQFAQLTATKDDAKPVRFDLPDPEEPSRQIRAEGYLYVYKVPLSDVAELARNDLIITDDQVLKLKSGSALTLRGYDPAGTLLYRIVVGMRL